MKPFGGWWLLFVVVVVLVVTLWVADPASGGPENGAPDS